MAIHDHGDSAVKDMVANRQRISLSGKLVVDERRFTTVSMGGATGGWRSNVTSDVFVGLVQANGLRIVEQFDEWRDGDRTFKISRYDDLFSVVQRCAA